MRKVLSSLAVGVATAQLLLAAPLPAIAVGPPGTALTTGSDAQFALPEMTVRKTKKESKKEKDLDSKIKISPMPNVKRGQTAVPVTVQVSRAGLKCKLSIKYYSTGDTDSPDDVVSDGNGICQFYFDAAKSRDAVGDATATVKVFDKGNNPQGEAKINFDVRS